ncbi:MAG: hypothetical protein H0U74_10675 [Bradymonadaceae bacterium]|nr:hypothetical protein [Lujinxingiaceae bacterium]
MKYIDLQSWPRRSHFEFFRSFHDPFLDICVRVEVTGLRNRARAAGESIFAAMLYESMAAINAVPELRQRIRGDQVVEHARVHPTFTVLNEAEIFNFCTGEFQEDRAAFFADTATRAAATKALSALDAGHDDARDDLVYVTSLPWLDFQSIGHAYAARAGDSNVRLAWGRIVVDDARRASVSVQLTAHHGLVDGLHAARFFKALEERCT